MHNIGLERIYSLTGKSTNQCGYRRATVDETGHISRCAGTVQCVGQWPPSKTAVDQNLN